MALVRKLSSIVLTIVTVLYPLLLFFGRQKVDVGAIALAMIAIWLFKALLARKFAERLLAVACMIFFSIIFLQSSIALMYWYPVIVSLVMLIVFFASLFARQTVIERFARLKEPDLPASGVVYTRRITQLWCVYFIVNIAIISGLILRQNWSWWMLYTGLISYIVMGVLFVGEWIYRHFVLVKEG